MTPVIVTLLTKADCQFCARASQILTRLRTEFAFELHTVDLTSQAGTALAAQHGVLFAPGVIIDGRLSSFGRPSERRLRRDLTNASGAPR